MAVADQEFLRTLPSPSEGGTRRSIGLQKFARNNPLGVAGLAMVILLLLSAVFAPLVSPYNPLAVAPADRLLAPSASHLFGTDDIGRDILSRVIYGGRVSLEVGFITVILGTLVGATIGLVSGYLAGTTDTVIQRLLDSVQSIPGLLLAIAIAAALGNGNVFGLFPLAIFPVAVVIVPINARVVRSSVLSIREHAYIEAARVIGCGNTRIILRHILPNVTAAILVLASIWVGNAIIIEASLSFLGLGTSPPTPSWGNMLAGQGRVYMEQAPWLAIFPGLAITLTVLAFNLFGDALRDTWDPRLRGR
ncbi:MAG TPA: ABC transporter permease [Dehalococcoidia bacterium]|nr:ABC transporter permease [Dehalococcoidia bacterium]